MNGSAFWKDRGNHTMHHAAAAPRIIDQWQCKHRDCAGGSTILKARSSEEAVSAPKCVRCGEPTTHMTETLVPTPDEAVL